MRSVGEEMERLRSLAEEKGAVAAPIDPGDVVVADWVRLKCRFGCKGYAKHLSCPPYSPTPEETRRLMGEFRHALLLRFDGFPGRDFGPEEIPEDFHPFYRDLILWVNETVLLLEKTAFFDGFYKAFSMGAYPCIYCDHCVAEEQEGPVNESLRRLCRHMDKVRPSMEGSGIDVFATAKRVGWDLSTIPCRNMEYGKIEHTDIRSVGILLME
ncbi:MAG: DUF2284 domain-containing protein [Methanomassiliicoccales archaeon]